MIPKLKPYPAYKDSGVPWLGKVPEHWEVIPGRACYQEQARSNNDSKELPVLSLSYGRIVIKPENKLHGLVPSSFNTYQVIEPGDIVIRPTDLQNDQTSLRFGQSQYKGIITSAYIVFRPTSLLDQKYGHLLLHSYDLMKIFYRLGSGLRQNLSWADFKYLPCLMPSHNEQVSISHYLNNIDHQIRRYIRAKQELIKLLEEQKQAIIHRAVTRGLNPDVRLKSSGVEWIGDVPKNWDIAALRHRYDQCLGKMLNSKRISGKHSLPYLRNTDIQWDRINTEDLPAMDIPPSEYERYTIKKGDLLVCEGGEIGRCAIWTGDRSLFGFQKALHRLRPKDGNQDIPRFMYYALQTATKSGAFNDGHLSTIAHLTGDKLRMHRFPFPPFAEQQSIIKFLDNSLFQIDRSISGAYNGISLLREYRTRLIADVVTGKLDVGEAAAQLPENAGDHESLEEFEVLAGSEDFDEDNESANELEEAEG